MAIKLDNMFDIQNPEGLEGLGTLNFLGGMPGTLTNIANVVAQQGSQLGPDDFGSYVIPASDPTYSTGFQYARSIAGGIPMSQVIAPGVSYSPEQPGGYTQAQLNTLVGTTPVETPPPPPPAQEPDDPRYFGTGIGGVRIPVDRDMKMPPLRDIFGTNISNLSNLFDLTKINKNLQLMSQKAKEAGITGTDGVDLTGESLRRAYDEGRGILQNMRGPFDIDQEAIDRIVQERIAERMPTIEQPDFSQFVRREDIPTLIPQVPTGRDLSVDREELIRDIREGIEIPKYEIPDLSQFARLEDIPTVPTLDREALIRDIRSGIDIPKPPSIDRQALIEDIRSGIELPTYQAPDLSGFARLEDIPKIPSREDFLSIAREGIEIPQYQAPDLSGFARLEDIPTFDPTGLQQQIAANQAAIAGIDIPTYQIPDVSQFVTQEDIQKAIAGIDMPTYQAPDLSAYDLRLAELEQQLAGLQQPTGGRFSISQPAPRGLI
jgi:hypothetical protein